MVEGRGPRVLLVDDAARVRRALRALLKADGVAVVGEAATPATALDLAVARRPQLILLDLLLPTATLGLALLPPLAPCPVVALSVHGGLRAAALEAGAVAFVEKGAAPEALIAACRAAVGRRAGLPE